MAHPSDQEVRRKLAAHGAAEHVVRGGAEGLISAWRAFVGSVETGYVFGIEDYRNDLDMRSLIAVAGLDAAVTEEDARFRSSLAHPERKVWSSGVPDAFWIHGYPRNASGQLLADLKAEGLA